MQGVHLVLLEALASLPMHSALLQEAEVEAEEAKLLGPRQAAEVGAGVEEAPHDL